MYVAPVDVILSQIDVVQPALVIEVLSPSTGPVDRGLKMETYAHFGVQEYWIADPDTRTLEIYRRRGRPAAPSSPPEHRPGPALSSSPT